MSKKLIRHNPATKTIVGQTNVRRADASKNTLKQIDSNP